MSVVDVELAHRQGASRFDRVLSVLVGLVAVAAAVLATLQVDASDREERANIQAARLSVRIFEGIATSGMSSSFGLETLKRAIVPGIASAQRQIASFDDPLLAPVEQAIAAAEEATSTRVMQVAEEMSAPPTGASGLDAHARRMLSISLGRLQAMSEEQNREVDRAEEAGLQGNRAVLALSLVAVAAVLLALAGVVGAGRNGWAALAAASVVLVAGAGWGVYAWLG